MKPHFLECENNQNRQCVWATHVIGVYNKPWPITTLLFQDFYKSFKDLFLQYIWWIFCQICMPPRSGKNFNFMVFKLLNNVFESQKLDLDILTHVPLQTKLSSKFLTSPSGLIHIHMTAIKHKKPQVIYTYQLTIKQIFMCKVMFFMKCGY